ncbi:MAG: HAMP domain-containing sensor histidine kinase [Planctomycetaceae bacterium]|nr:HAMP domain-containing sensor histidine kinase [Planctomycetaceae bacterium]
MPLRQSLSRSFRTIRVQLTIWNTIVVLLAVLFALAAVRERLRYSLLSETDHVLNDEVKELTLAVKRCYPDLDQVRVEMEQKANSHRERGWHIRWLNDRRETLWVGPPENSPPQPLSEEVGTLEGAAIWASSQYRAVERQVVLPGIPRYFIRVGTKTEFIAQDVYRLTELLAPVGFALLLLAPLGGFLLADRAIAPVQKIIATTERLRPSQLKERLEVRGVGDELDQLAIKINHFLDEIADHLRRKRDFVANAAHELRSPITAIQSSVEVALERERTPAEYEDLLILIADECRHLGQLVSQLLQLAEAQSEVLRVTFAPVRLDEIVQRTVEMFAPVAEERNVTLAGHAEQPVSIQGNRQQLRQLITNFVDNAVKFTPPGGRVDVRVDTDFTAQRTRLTVADTGIGIPAEHLPRIFERFYQVSPSRTRDTDSRGNGLGLSICRAIIDQHQGTIAVESTPGKGTKFTIEFPIV